MISLLLCINYNNKKCQYVKKRKKKAIMANFMLLYLLKIHLTTNYKIC